MAQRKIDERRVNLFPVVGISWKGMGWKVARNEGKKRGGGKLNGNGNRERERERELGRQRVLFSNKNGENRNLSSSGGQHTFSLETLFFLFPFSFIHARAALLDEGSSIFGIRSRNVTKRATSLRVECFTIDEGRAFSR